MMCDVNQKEG